MDVVSALVISGDGISGDGISGDGISGDGVPPYSARGLDVTLEPIAVPVPVRTINGGLLNLAPPEFQKYRLTLGCTDVDVPAFAGLWPGALVSVIPPLEVAYNTATGSPPDGRSIAGSRTDGDHTFVTLDLLMMVMGPWQQVRNEAGEQT
jgi:hypothetical protein